jgi:hypothetical protein
MVLIQEKKMRMGYGIRFIHLYIRSLIFWMSKDGCSVISLSEDQSFNYKAEKTRQNKGKEQTKYKTVGTIHSIVLSTWFQMTVHCWTSFRIAPASRLSGIALLSKTCRHRSFRIFQTMYTNFCKHRWPSWRSSFPSRIIPLYHVLKRWYVVLDSVYKFIPSQVASSAQIIWEYAHCTIMWMVDSGCAWQSW